MKKEFPMAYLRLLYQRPRGRRHLRGHPRNRGSGRASGAVHLIALHRNED